MRLRYSVKASTLPWVLVVAICRPALAAEIFIDSSEGCFAHRDLVDQVEQLLGKDVEELEPTTSVHVEVRHPSGGGYALVVTTHIDGELGVKSVELDDCRQVLEAASLLTVLAIDPDFALEPGRWRGEPNGEPHVPPVERFESVPSSPSRDPLPDSKPTELDPNPAPPVPPTPPVVEKRKQRIDLEVEGTTIGHSGVLPDAGIGIGLGVGLVGPLWAMDLGGAWFPSRFAELDDSARGAELNLVFGRLRGCVLSPTPSTRLGVCGAAELGRMGGQSVNLRSNDGGGHVWLAGLAGPVVEYHPASFLASRLHFDVAYAFSQPRFVIDDHQVYKPPPWGIRVELGLELRLGRLL